MNWNTRSSAPRKARIHRLAVTCGVTLACTAAAPAAAHADVGGPSDTTAWTAHVVKPAWATVYAGHGTELQHVGRLSPYWGGPNVLLVLNTATVDGQEYVKVLLKRMPAGSAGWIPAADVRLAQTARRVVVDLSARSITVRDAGRAILRARVVIGKPSTPTPTGQFAVDAPADQPAGGVLGRRILLLDAYSRALARYDGGIPQVAFHAYERLGAPLGSAASHGCIRMAQATLDRLLRLAPRGTPVLIRQ